MTIIKRITSANSRFVKAGISCFYENEVLKPSSVLLMKFSAEYLAFANRQNVTGHAKRSLQQIYSQTNEK